MISFIKEVRPRYCPGDAGVAAAEEKGELRHCPAGDEGTEECKSYQVISLGLWNVDFNVLFD